jgi:predicted nucleotidyltransferase
MKERIPQAPECEIISGLQAELPAILQGRPVMLAYLFGSAAEGTALPSSDVDIALVLEPKCDISAYARMKMEFDIAAEVEARCKIKEADVRSIDSAPLTVKGMILTEGILLYSRDEEFRVDYETHYRKMYFDFLPVVKMMREAFSRQVKEKGLSGGKARQS